MRNKRTLQEELFSSALARLQKELASMRKSEAAFLRHYRTARLHAFEIEFLAKFLRKSNPQNTDRFESIGACAKGLEDRLGDFNEIDEMLAFCEQHQIFLGPDLPAARHFLVRRKIAFKKVTRWLHADGWWGDHSSLDFLAQNFSKLEILDDEHLRASAIKKMSKVMRELQQNIADGAYDPRKKSGYTMAEVEPKVHELRREIRKIPMYANYLDSVFALDDQLFSPAKKMIRHYAPLLRRPIARSPFARLPKANITRPLLLPRAPYLGITKYVSELGNAKDWAQQRDQLVTAGLLGTIDFDHLDPLLRDVEGQPRPFNRMVTEILDEIRATKIFALMADLLEKQE